MVREVPTAGLLAALGLLRPEEEDFSPQRRQRLRRSSPVSEFSQWSPAQTTNRSPLLSQRGVRSHAWRRIYTWRLNRKGLEGTVGKEGVGFGNGVKVVKIEMEMELTGVSSEFGRVWKNLP